MTMFWLYAGLLLAAAPAFILLPQLRRPRRGFNADRASLNVDVYRERLNELETLRDAGTLDAEQFNAGRDEAARVLLDDAQDAPHPADAPLGRTVPLVAALSTPLLALVLYLHWGSSDQLMQEQQDAGLKAQNVEKVAMRLEALLAATPDSAEGWSLLGRAYAAQERMADAARAFERAANLAGRPPQLLGRWAEALYFAGGRQWTPKLKALTDEALAGDPQEATSLKLAGMAAFEAGRFAEASAYWERLAAILPEGDPHRAAIADDIARARESAMRTAAKGASQ
ncbi:MAG TPA: c-type cytochrome biogenesis protein CcmI [Herbaspirillum sp.]|jgi:cytochrome c-type biogenesis protein CcmH